MSAKNQNQFPQTDEFFDEGADAEFVDGLNSEELEGPDGSPIAYTSESAPNDDGEPKTDFQRAYEEAQAGAAAEPAAPRRRTPVSHRKVGVIGQAAKKVRGAVGAVSDATDSLREARDGAIDKAKAGTVGRVASAVDAKLEKWTAEPAQMPSQSSGTTEDFMHRPRTTASPTDIGSITSSVHLNGFTQVAEKPAIETREEDDSGVQPGNTLAPAPDPEWGGDDEDLEQPGNATTTEAEAEKTAEQPVAPLSPEEARAEARRRAQQPERKHGQAPTPQTLAYLAAAGPIDTGGRPVAPSRLKAGEKTPDSEPYENDWENDGPEDWLNAPEAPEAEPEATEESDEFTKWANEALVVGNAPAHTAEAEPAAKPEPVASKPTARPAGVPIKVDTDNLYRPDYSGSTAPTPEASGGPDTAPLGYDADDEFGEALNRGDLPSAEEEPDATVPTPEVAIAEPDADTDRPRHNRRRRIIAGAVAATALAGGLAFGLGGGQYEGPHRGVAIAAPANPGGEHGGSGTSVDGGAPKGGGHNGSTTPPKTEHARTIHAGNEDLTISADGSEVTITLNAGGTDWDGIAQAEHYLHINADDEHTDEAVQSMHLKPGQDRKMSIGSHKTFVLKDGKLVAK